MDSPISLRPRRILLLALLVAWCSSVAPAGGTGPTGNSADKEQVLIPVSGSYGDELTDSIRRLTEDMRPGMLDLLGLVASDPRLGTNATIAQ